MKKLLYTFLAISLIFSACEKEESSSNNSSATSPFSGMWVGTYDGDESGTWWGTVSADGAITGVAGPYTGTGNVENDGEWFFGNVSSGATFDGIANGSTVDGTWTNSSVQPIISGSWEGYKQ